MNKKEIVELIHKYSQIPQLSKGKVGDKTTIAPTKSNTNSGVDSLWSEQKKDSHPNTNQVAKINSLDNVKQLQSYIHELANVVMEASTFTKSLNDFVASHYLSSLDPQKKGIELQSTTQVTNNKNQIDTYEIDIVMGNLQKITQDVNALKINGVWNLNTDNSLRNILGLAYSLLQLEGDFRLKNQTYTSKNWEEFYKLLSGYTIKNNLILLPKEEQEKRAALLINHIKLVKNLYNSFKFQIQAKPEYRSLIEIKKPLDKYQDSSSQLNDEEENMLENPYLTIKVQGKAPNSDNFMDFTIPLTAFSNKENFMSFMKNYNINDEEIALKYLNYFIKSINNLGV